MKLKEEMWGSDSSSLGTVSPFEKQNDSSFLFKELLAPPPLPLVTLE